MKKSQPFEKGNMTYYTLTDKIQLCPGCGKRMNFVAQGWNVWTCCYGCPIDVMVIESDDMLQANLEDAERLLWICNDN